MDGYKASVKECSKELTVKEKIALKDTSNAIGLDLLTQEANFNGEKVIIEVDYYATINIHNEKSDNKDYINFIVVAKDGTKYVTGSQAFISAFEDIANELAEAGETDMTIEVYRKESKNYKGKDFITCSIV